MAGCQASPTLQRWSGDAPAPDPIVVLEREDVGPTHDRSFLVEVGDRARELNVSVDLLTRSPALALSPPPARLEVEVRAPSGALVRNATLDPSSPRFTFATEDLAERGEYLVRVHGQGVSQTLQGQGYGAAYVLAIEVEHG